MPDSEASSLETPVEGLRSTPPSHLLCQANVLVRSFLLERPAGNVVVYNSPGLTSAAMDIRDLGGASHLLINHWYEAMYGTPDLDVPAFVHESDRGKAVQSMRIAGVFTGRQTIDDDSR